MKFAIQFAVEKKNGVVTRVGRPIAIAANENRTSYVSRQTNKKYKEKQIA